MPATIASRIIEEVSQRSGASRSAIGRPQTILGFVAKDTEKLIRQLSLISFLMAQGRPVSALEIKREVEGYSDMNDDAFARRFYADRAELESLGIQLGVEKPGEGFFEAELYSLPPENFYLDAISFDDAELAALSTALLLLTDGGFAYAEPLRLALQQVAWGHPNPLTESETRAPVEMAMTASAGGRDLSQRRAPAAATSRSGCRRSRPRSRAARRSSSPTSRWSAATPRSARSTPTTWSSAAGSST